MVHSVAKVLHVSLVVSKLGEVDVGQPLEVDLQVIHHLDVLLLGLASGRRVVKNVVNPIESLLVLLNLDG